MPSPEPQRQTRLVLAGCVVASLLLLLANHMQQGVIYKIWDDAWISYRYAHNWLAGMGLVYNAGERVEGYSNFLWIVLHALGMSFGQHPVVVTYVLGPILGLLALAATVLTARRVLREPWAAVIAAFFLAFDEQFNRWHMSGMETPLVDALLVGALWGWSIDRTRPAFPWRMTLCLVTLSMTRPEGIALGGVTIGALMLFSPAERRWTHWRPLAMGGAGTVAGWLVYFLCRWAYYGQMLPNPFAIKVGHTWAQVERGWAYLQSCHGHIGLAIVLPVAILGLAMRPDPILRTAAVLILWQSAYVTAIGGDWMGLRFYCLAVPMWALLFGAGLGAGVELLRRRGVSPLINFAMVASVWLAYGHHQYGQYPRHFRNPLALFTKDITNDPTRAGILANSLAGQFQAKEVRLATHIGEVAYHYRGPILDASGLNDPFIAHRPRPVGAPEMGRGAPGHEFFDFNFILSKDPELIFSEFPDFKLGVRTDQYEIVRVPNTTHGFLFVRINKAALPQQVVR